MKTMTSVLLAALLALPALAQESSDVATIHVKEGDPGEVSLSLSNEGRAAVDRGMKWLLAQQSPEGHWSNPEFPALTALAVWALAANDCADQAAIDKGTQYILSCVREDGSIFRDPSEQRKGGGLANYNTAICMVALHAVGKPEFTPVILKARKYLAGSQHLGGDDYRGGMGYDPDTGRPYADLSNSYIAYEAMRLTESVEDLRAAGDARADLDWKAAQAFLEKIQNKPEGTNDDNAGGFAYHPNQSQAGTTTNEAGEVRFRSYGSMTYAGMLSLIYAEVDRNDPRVESAFDWSARHWTLEENPGMGQQGLYYFYNVLSKSLAAYGRDQIPLAAGGKVNWRNEVVKKLVSLQKTDPATGSGYWLNPEGRWWESDPVLVTAYSLLALDVALK